MNIEEKEVKKSKVEMSTLDCYMDTFNKFFTFKGRASKYEYWSFAFVNCIVSIVLSILDFIPTLGYVSSLYIFIITIPSTTLSVRRLHDVGKSGWMLVYPYIALLLAIFSLIIKVPVLAIVFGAICLILFIYIIYLTFIRGNTEENRFGEPKYAEDSYNKKANKSMLNMFLITISFYLILIIFVVTAGYLGGEIDIDNGTIDFENIFMNMNSAREPF